MSTPFNPLRVNELIEVETAKLLANTPESKRVFENASRHLSGGVASSYQDLEPYPLFIRRGEGPKVWDVDGNEYYDFHNAGGSMVQGHAHPAIGKAVAARYQLGTHFCAPTEDMIAVSDELARRFGLPKWRFTNSGSESTMDAIRIARGATGRDTVMKIFGSYHGHHDTVMVDIGFVDVDDRGPRDNYASISYGGGIPEAVASLTVAVPFNDADAMERRIVALEAEGRKPACVIMEAAMMNLGVVLPEPGYLQSVRAITARHDIPLIFDEVKTGLLIAAGGATEKYGVVPDMLTISKSLGGGFPSGAIGMSEKFSEVVEDGTVYQVGTYNGNPVTMAAAYASLMEVLTPEAYKHLDYLSDRMLAGCDDVIKRYDLTAYTVGIGSKGSVVFSDRRVVDYETYWANKVDVGAMTRLAWLYYVNRGVFMTPAREHEWTLSVTHDDAAIDSFVSAFDELAAALRA